MTYNLGTIETGDMNEEWKQWEGRTVDGIFPLNRYFGGSDHSAVFQTNRQSGAGESESAAIKLVPADASDGEKQLARWRAARELDHPNLIRVFAAGRSEVDGAEVLYVVEEYAEENLAQILPERALTAEEARMMLPPVLSALRYVHARGLVHGRIQPSNILAIGDQVKLSSDSLGAPGETTGTPDAYDPPEAGGGARSAAGDVWRLGMTLVEVLTQRLPERDRSKAGAPDIPLEVPEPFREIAARCLQVDPEKRWTIAEIAARLETGQAERAATPSQTHAMAAVPLLPGRESLGGEHPPQANKSAKWPYVLLLAVVVVVILFLMTRAKTTGTPNGTSAEGVQSSATQAGSSPTSPGAQGAGDGVLKRVMPEISPSARRTIRGTIVIRVTVHVDAAGEVTTAKIESGRASKYFSREALEAAREWKFASAADGTGTREWKVQFRFSRVRTEASAARVKG